MPFPPGSIRRAVADYGDNWGIALEPPPSSEECNPVFRAERHDADVMRRCYAPFGANQQDRGTVWDPRVWIGVPLVERAA